MEEWKTEKKINKIDTTAIVINTIIAINNKEGRKIIDSTDINNFITTLQSECEKRDVAIQITDASSENIKAIEDYLYPYKQGDDTCYMVLPWIKPTDMYYFDIGTISLELSAILFDSFSNKLKDRDEESKRLLNKTYNKFVDNYISIMEKEIMKDNNPAKEYRLAAAKVNNNRT